MTKGHRLADRIRQITVRGLGRGSDLAWIRFVKDHKRFLLSKAKSRKYVPLDLIPYRFRPEEFWVEKLNGTLDAAWIFMFINDLRDVSDFNESINRLLVITNSDVEKLRQQYEASASYHSSLLSER